MRAGCRAVHHGGFLRWRRETLELKCSRLAVADLPAVPRNPPRCRCRSALDDVERGWFCGIMAGHDVPPHFSSGTDRDADVDGAVPDPEVVAEAWNAWRAEAESAAPSRPRRQPATATDHRRAQRSARQCRAADGVSGGARLAARR